MNTHLPEPNNTAVRTALWRALHVQIDPAPPIFNDTLGLQLIQPDEDWQTRPDMDKEFTKRVRVSIATRARFVEDLVETYYQQGINQYLILGAGLDTFAQRHPERMSRLHVFEIDEPNTLTWKQQRLAELGYSSSDHLHYVAVDFEKESWWEALLAAGFVPDQPAVVCCTGLSLYLTREANLQLLQQFGQLAKGSVCAMTFLLPMSEIEDADKMLMEISMKGAERSGNPFQSQFTHNEILQLATETGLQQASIVSKADLLERYFAHRTDHLEPASGEDVLVIKL